MSFRRDPNVDLEAKFEPSLLNSAVYLLQLIQQISTFAINFQGRPFRENLSENRTMYLGIVGVSALAFACSTEFIPEINQNLSFVPFTSEFKVTMTATMVIDYVGCWIIEKGLKAAFSDYKPKDIAIRRPEQIVREDKRRLIEMEEELEKKAQEEEKKRQAKREAGEKAIAEIRAKWERRRAA